MTVDDGLGEGFGASSAPVTVSLLFIFAVLIRVVVGGGDIESKPQSIKLAEFILGICMPTFLTTRRSYGNLKFPECVGG